MRIGFHSPAPLVFTWLTLVLCPGLGGAGAREATDSLKADILGIINSTPGISFEQDQQLEAAAGTAAVEIAGSGQDAGSGQEAVHEAIVSALRRHAVTDAKIFHAAIISDSRGDLLESFTAFMKMDGFEQIDGRHIGIEAFITDSKALCVLICVDRVVTMSGVPGRIAKPAKVMVKGTALKKVEGLHVMVQTPGMDFLKPTVHIKGSTFTVLLPLNGSAGQYRIEVLGDLGYGPSVLNLFTITVGSGEAGENEFEAARTAAAAAKAKPGKGKNRNAWGLFHLINALRAVENLPELKVDEALTQTALSHVKDMKKGAYFGHTSPSQGTFDARIKAAGVKSSSVSEVITEAAGPEGALKNLIASPSHLMQILGKDYTHMGAALIKTGQGRLFVVVFAKY
ncbi:MAG: CAP domain-containing protein [Pseudomonadota bacterium]